MDYCFHTIQISSTPNIFLKILTLPFFTSSLFLPSFFSSYITHLHFLLVELLLLCCGCFCRGALLLWLIICYIDEFLWINVIACSHFCSFYFCALLILASWLTKLPCWTWSSWRCQKGACKNSWYNWSWCRIQGHTCC